MQQAARDQANLSVALLASVLVHVGAAWMLTDPSTPVATDYGLEQVVAVQLLARTPLPTSAPASPPAPPTVAPPPPDPREQTPVEAPKPKTSPPRDAVAPPAPRPQPTPAAEPVAAIPIVMPPVAAAPAVASVSPVEAAPPPVGTQEDELARYVERIRDLVHHQKRYPRMARKRGIEGLVTIRLRIDASGSVDALEIESGAPGILSRATEQAVRQAAPFPAPPDGANVILLDLEYSLRDYS